MIRWSPRGRLRLRQCAKYILQESQDWLTTVKWRNEIDEAVTTLEDFALKHITLHDIITTVYIMRHDIMPNVEQSHGGIGIRKEGVG